MLQSNNAIIERAVDAWMEEDVDVQEETVNYRKGTVKKILFILILLAIAVVAAGYAMAVGTYPISFLDTYRVVWDHFFGEIWDETADYLIFEWRLPRICTGILAGIGLAAAGVVMQSILRNPLADPYTTGISSGASFGATVAIGLGISLAGGTYAIVSGAFVFSLIPTAMILAVSKMRGASPTTMIMAGIAVMYIFNAMTTMIKLFVSPDQLQAIFAWSVGSLDGATWTQVGTMLTFVVVGYLILQFTSRRLNVLSTGDESSRSIGIDANKLRIICLLVVSFLTAGVVSFTGLIGFIGLVSPHICRLVIGSDNRFLIPASAAFGAALLTVADIIGRTVIQPSTIQVGVITAFIGGPLFLYLIIKQRRSSRCRSCR
jgi:iron complex transport system permease protein